MKYKLNTESDPVALNYLQLPYTTLKTTVLLTGIY